MSKMRTFSKAQVKIYVNRNKKQSIAKFKCVGVNINYMIFFQQDETSSVMRIDFCTNKNQDPKSEAQTLLNFL